MSNTKICPACQKELPVLAVRCKYCGFKQPLDADEDELVGKQMTKPLGVLKTRSTTASGPKVQTTLPPRSITSKAASSEKKKTSMGVGARTLATLSSRSAATGRPLSRRTSTPMGVSTGSPPNKSQDKSPDKSLDKPTDKSNVSSWSKGKGDFGFAAKPAGARQTILGAAGPKKEPAFPTDVGPSAAAVSQSNAVPKSKPPRPSAMMTRPAKIEMKKLSKPASPPPMFRGKRILDDSTGEDWIPQVDDDSQLIALDTDGVDATGPSTDTATQEVELSDLSIITGPVDATAASIDIAAPPAARWMSRWMSRIRDGVQSGVKRGGTGLYMGLGKLRGRAVQFGGQCREYLEQRSAAPKRIHLIVAGIGAVLVLGLIILVAAVGGNPETKSVAAPEPEGHTVKKRISTKPVAKQAATKHIEKTIEKTSLQPSAAEAKSESMVSPVLSNRPCQPLTHYASFSLDGAFRKAVKWVGGKSVCDIMGRDVKTIVAAFSAEQIAYVGGYDGLEGGTMVEVVDGDGADAEKSHLVRFLFYRDQLYRIVFEYGLTAALGVDMGVFESLWKKKSATYRLPEQLIVAIDDGEVRLELVTDRIGPANRRAVISDLKVGRELALKLDSHWRAVQRAASGAVLMEKKRFEKAAKKYRAALRESSSYGAAYLGLAGARLGMGDSQGAEKALEAGMKAARDDRMKAAIRERLDAIRQK